MASSSRGPSREDGAATADRFEVLAGDLVKRLDIRHRQEPTALGVDVLAAAERLKAFIAEVGASWEFTNPSVLISGQGRHIRGLQDAMRETEGRLAEACGRIADLADEREQLLEELAQWRAMSAQAAREADSTTSLADALQVEASNELKAWRAPCVRCNRPRYEHKKPGECPRGSQGGAKGGAL